MSGTKELPCKICGKETTVDIETESVTCGYCAVGIVIEHNRKKREKLKSVTGEMVRNARKMLGLTQKDLSDALRNTTPWQISQIENDKIVCTESVFNWVREVESSAQRDSEDLN